MLKSTKIKSILMNLITHLPFQAPNFPDYTGENYRVAILNAIKEAQTLQQELSNLSDYPTFKNTVLALEKIHQTIANVREPFALASFDSRPDIQETEEAITGPLSRFESQLFQDKGIWERLTILNQDQIQKDALNKDSAWLLKQYVQKFKRAGAHLSAENQKTLQDLHEKLAENGVLFGKNVLKATQEPCWVEDLSWLNGLSLESIDIAKKYAIELGNPDAWAFKIDMPNTRKILKESANPKLREKLWSMFFYRCHSGDLDNHSLIKEQLKIRAKIAKIMGYPNWASFILDEMMARTPNQALDLMTEVWDKIKIHFEQQTRRLQEELSLDFPEKELLPSDWFYYADKVRQKDYSFNNDEMKEYFLYNQVRQGLFDVVYRLFGLKFEITDLPGFAEQVSSYIVKKDQKEIGVLYLDDFQRNTKRGGAWMESGRSQSNMNDVFIMPIVANALNICPSLSGEVKLSMEEVVTMFHELGHGLHGLLSKVRYPTQNGLTVPTDFVELPSQVLENWALEPEVIMTFAKNEKGETIPNHLIESWQKAQRFDGIFERAEYLISAFQDLRLHMLSKEELDNLSLSEFEQNLNEELGCPNSLKARYHLSNFNHIFSWDYSSRYYAYLWSAVLDADAFQSFKEKGLFDAKTAENLEKNIYAIGHSRPVEESFEQFKGRPPETKALLEREGLLALELTPTAKLGVKLK